MVGYMHPKEKHHKVTWTSKPPTDYQNWRVFEIFRFGFVCCEILLDWSDPVVRGLSYALFGAFVVQGWPLAYLNSDEVWRLWHSAEQPSAHRFSFLLSIWSIVLMESTCLWHRPRVVVVWLLVWVSDVSTTYLWGPNSSLVSHVLWSMVFVRKAWSYSFIEPTWILDVCKANRFT